jgi:hypothetical protein
VSSAARVQRHRERARNGKVVFRVEADEVEVEALLVEAGFLPPEGTDDRTAIERGLTKLIEVLALDGRNALQRDL